MATATELNHSGHEDIDPTCRDCMADLAIAIHCDGYGDCWDHTITRLPTGEFGCEGHTFATVAAAVAWLGSK